MDVALINVVGSGFAVVSSGYGYHVPDDAVRNGYALVNHLVGHRGASMKVLIEDIVTELWSGWRAAKMPRAAAKYHVEGLPEIVALFAPPADYFVSGLANTAAARRRKSADAAAPARLIAAETVMRAREKNAFEKADLNESLCYFLFECLYARLLAERELYDDLRPVLEDYFGAQIWAEPVASPAATAETSQDYEAFDVSGAAEPVGDQGDLAEPWVAEPYPAETDAGDFHQDEQPLALDEAGDTFADQLDAGEPAAVPLRVNVPAPAPARVASPQAAADAQNAAPTERYTPPPIRSALRKPRGAPAVPVKKPVLSDAEKTELIALEEIVGQYRTLLAELADKDGDGAFIEDLRDARLGLGQTLLEIGAMTKDKAVLEESSGYLNTGLDELNMMDDLETWMEGQMSLGQARWQLGQITGDTETLDDAIMSIAAVCEVVPGDADPELRVDAHMALGGALVTRAAKSKGVEELERATHAFETALEAIGRGGRSLEWALISNQLGSLIWEIGTRREDADTMGQAADIKLAAMDCFEEAGEMAEAERIRDELFKINEERVKLGGADELPALSRIA